MALMINIGPVGESCIVLDAPQAVALADILRDPAKVKDLLRRIEGTFGGSADKPTADVATIQPTAKRTRKNAPRKSTASLAESIPTETLVPSGPEPGKVALPPLAPVATADRVKVPAPRPGGAVQTIPAEPTTVETVTPPPVVEPTPTADVLAAPTPVKPTVLEEIFRTLPDGRHLFITIYTDGTVDREVDEFPAVANAA